MHDTSTKTSELHRKPLQVPPYITTGIKHACEQATVLIVEIPPTSIRPKIHINPCKKKHETRCKKQHTSSGRGRDAPASSILAKRVRQKQNITAQERVGVKRSTETLWRRRCPYSMFTHLDTAPLALFAGLLRPRLAADAFTGAAKLSKKKRGKKK